MRIAVDISSLVDSRVSGVGYYTKHLLEHLLAIDTDNSYILFYTGIRHADLPWLKRFEGSRVQLRHLRYPNKALHAFFVLFNWPSLDRMLGGVDILFAPNVGFLSMSKRVRFILTVHDLSFRFFPALYPWKRRLWHWFIRPRHLLNKADAILVPSEQTKHDLVRAYNVDEKKIRITPLGVDTAYFSAENNAQTPKPIDSPMPYVLYVGNIEPRKNIEFLLQSFMSYKKTHKGTLRLLLIGDPYAHSHGYFQHLKRFVNEREDIQFLLYREERSLPSLYRNSSAFLYPSLYEGFGLPPLEAMASGVPVIVSATSSLVETVGDAGLVVDPTNVAEVSRALDTVLSDERVRRALIAKGRDRSKQYTWDRTARETLGIFSFSS